MDIYPEYDYTFICGHVPVQDVRAGQMSDEHGERLESYRYENIVNIDGGCARGPVENINNRAVFLCLNDLKEYSVPFRNLEGIK